MKHKVAKSYFQITCRIFMSFFDRWWIFNLYPLIFLDRIGQGLHFVWVYLSIQQQYRATLLFTKLCQSDIPDYLAPDHIFLEWVSLACSYLPWIEDTVVCPPNNYGVFGLHFWLWRPHSAAIMTSSFPSTLIYMEINHLFSFYWKSAIS